MLSPPFAARLARWVVAAEDALLKKVPKKEVKLIVVKAAPGSRGYQRRFYAAGIGKQRPFTASVR